uniref:helix-turn-helix domain-containing protein n=1 Tax=uncultured Ruminococcus sp. TaxID=165186 RepID=UPI002675794E
MFLLRRIRNLREDADLRQTDIADYLHCSQVTYSRYELGTREIPLEALGALAVACHAKRKKLTRKTKKTL